MNYRELSRRAGCKFVHWTKYPDSARDYNQMELARLRGYIEALKDSRDSGPSHRLDTIIDELCDFAFFVENHLDTPEILVTLN